MFSEAVCKTRTFALGDKPHYFFAPEGKPPRRGLNPRPLVCGNNLPKVTLGYVHSDSVGNSGGILCVWDTNSFKKLNATVSDYFVMIRGVPVSILSKYYDAGYKAVRKHAPNAFVILATRIGGYTKELFPLAKGMQKVVLDVHYYNLFSDIFNDMTVEQNINFIQTNHSNDLQDITTSDGPLTFVEENIQKTVRVIEFFTARYSKNPSLYALELINEPRAPGVPLSILSKYYDAGYKAVRKHAPNAFVILATQLSGDAKELFPLAKGMQNVILDVHYYNLFSDIFNDMTVEQNINFIQTNRSNDLQDITTSDGPLTFVGEWLAEWQARGASKEDFQRFSKAQLDVFGRASLGWAYWSLKNVNDHWSMEWMIKNGYTKL
uniref:Probable glucan 1,3-beta-glucosidase A n=1 Tax=Tanacetum cinerariifolium TaxID=118510 RepID=A0A6L2NLX3_TANCI|nr:probable glucan 1,3-beta-glucosidase A [Tanacetum cinerariifolium]